MSTDEQKSFRLALLTQEYMAKNQIILKYLMFSISLLS